MGVTPISLTTGMRNALGSLGELQDQITTTNFRLASGKKVNSALDNAVNFFTAQSLNDRAKGLAVIQDNIGLGINLLKNTDKALASIKLSLEQAEGSLKASLNSTGTNARAVTNFAFRNNQGVADASVAFSEVAAGVGQNRFQAGDSFSIRLATVTSTGSANSLATGATLTIATASTVQEVINAINNDATINVPGQERLVEAYLNDAGNLVIENKRNATDASGNTYALQFVTNTAASVNGNVTDIFTFSGGVGAVPNVQGTTGTQTTLITGSSTRQATRDSSATAFREVLNQIRNSALDAGYNGTNLLNGDSLITYFNDDLTTSLATRGNRLDAAALNLRQDNQTAQDGDSLFNFQSDKEIQNALAKLRTAKATIVAQSSSYATNFNILSNRQDYTKSLISNLNAGADQLTLADINEEGAKLSSLQTRQQLSVTALSLANQSDQAILRLF
ncbi:MAG: flagellin [Bosea sp. (in: a-proteobacteria)]